MFIDLTTKVADKQRPWVGRQVGDAVVVRSVVELVVDSVVDSVVELVVDSVVDSVVESWRLLVTESLVGWPCRS